MEVIQIVQGTYLPDFVVVVVRSELRGGTAYVRRAQQGALVLLTQLTCTYFEVSPLRLLKPGL